MVDRNIKTSEAWLVVFALIILIGGSLLILNHNDNIGKAFVGSKIGVQPAVSKDVISPVYHNTFWDVPHRGVGVNNPGSTFNERTLITLKSWGVNIIRIHLVDVPSTNYDSVLDDLERKVDLAESYNISVVVALMSMQDVYSLNGGNLPDSPFWTDFSLQQKIIQFWSDAAKRFKGRNIIVGFDLINEPAPTYYDRGTICTDRGLKCPCQYETDPLMCPAEPETARDLGYFYTRAIRTIREVDPTRTMVLEGKCGAGLCFKSVNGTWQLAVAMATVNEPNVIYSLHYYYSNYYTGQGLDGNLTPQYYPGTSIYYGYFDRNRTRAEIKKISDWAVANNAKIFIGEYSVITDAPNASNWLRDVTDSFEEFNFTTSYHHFRENWWGWDLEYNCSACDPSYVPNCQFCDPNYSRLNVMKNYWLNNVRSKVAK